MLQIVAVKRECFLFLTPFTVFLSVKSLCCQYFVCFLIYAAGIAIVNSLGISFLIHILPDQRLDVALNVVYFFQLL